MLRWFRVWALFRERLLAQGGYFARRSSVPAAFGAGADG